MHPTTPLDDATHITWEALSAAIAKPSAADVDHYGVRDDEAELTALGARISTAKVLTDYVRWCGEIHAFWSIATAEQRALVYGFSDAYLRVVFADGLALRDLLASKTTHATKSAPEQAKDLATADETFERGRKRRERLNAALISLTTARSPLAAQIHAAYGTAADADELSQSLTGLTGVARGLLKDAKSREAKRLSDGGLTATELDAIDALAADVVQTDHRASGARAHAPVTQSQLDLHDGICLRHMQALMALFNTSHEEHPEVPALYPNTTHSVLGSHAKTHAAASAPTDASTPAPVPTTPASGKKG